MNNLTPLGMVLSILLSGASFNETTPYVVNNSQFTIYYKPESATANPGLLQDAAYPIAPGETLYAAVDAIVTPAIPNGKIYRVPTGGKIIVNKDGVPSPSGLMAKAGELFSAYGITDSPCEGFAILANSKHILFAMPDVIAKLN